MAGAQDDLTSGLAALGIDPAQLAAILAGAGGTADPYAAFTGTDTSAKVYTGTEQVPGRAPSGQMIHGTVDHLDQSGRLVHGTPNTMDQGTPSSTRDTTANLGDLLKQFYSLPADELARYQRLMFASGMYGNTDISEVHWGVADQQSFQAWAQAVTSASRSFAAGKKVTIDDLLVSMVQSAGLGGAGKKGKDISVSLTSERDLQKTLDQVSQSTLGRKANVNEQRMFVAMFHAMQDAAQTKQQIGQNGIDPNTPLYPLTTSRAGLSPVTDAKAYFQGKPDVNLSSAQQAAKAGSKTVVEQPNAASEADAALRAQNPEEAGAHDIANQFDMFLKLIRGPMG